MSDLKKNVVVDLKQQRRAQALRLNLRKRKQQQQARDALSSEELLEVIDQIDQISLENPSPFVSNTNLS